MSIRNNALSGFTFLVAFVSCRQTELHSNADVAQYCELKKGGHLSYESLQDALYYTNASSRADSHIVHIKVVGDDGVAGLDTCWVDIEYDPEAQQITGCTGACQ